MDASVFAGLRLSGKRELGQMTVFDLMVVLLIANAMQNAMVGADVSRQELEMVVREHGVDSSRTSGSPSWRRTGP